MLPPGCFNGMRPSPGSEQPSGAIVLQGILPHRTILCRDGCYAQNELPYFTLQYQYQQMHRR